MRLIWVTHDFVLCLQQDEIPDELLTFHEAVNHIQEMEEDIIDDHKSLIEVCLGFMYIEHYIGYECLKNNNSVKYTVCLSIKS